jgi:hypothetical protein
MANLELDLKRRKEEAQRKASWDYKAPESVRDADPGIDDEAYAAEMGIGPDPEGKPKMKPFSEVEKLIADIKSVFGPDALGYTDKEREAWIKENFEGKNLTQLTKDERKQVLAMARKMLKARDEAELKGVA